MEQGHKHIRTGMCETIPALVLFSDSHQLKSEPDVNMHKRQRGMPTPSILVDQPGSESQPIALDESQTPEEDLSKGEDPLSSPFKLSPFSDDDCAESSCYDSSEDGKVCPLVVD